MHYNIFTDGSCQNNGEPNAMCGWGFLVADKEEIITEKFGKIRQGAQTVFRSELEAFLQALLHIRESSKDKHFTIYTDSMMLSEAVNGLCSRRSNKDIWNQIEEVSMSLLGRVTVRHINSHQGNECYYNEMNNKVDKLAKQGALNLFGAPVKVVI